jgi:molybdenum cofactor biosynthesis enzyme MoaA
MKTCKIITSLKCNLDCHYCCNKIDNVNKFFKKLDSNNLYSILNQYNTFHITGGEPLLNNNTFKVIKYIRENNKNSKQYLYTNGTLLNILLVDLLKNFIDGINIGIHHQKINLNNIKEYNKIIPVSIYIQDKKINDNLIYFCNTNNIRLETWTLNKCNTNLDIFLLT